jgi:hypothetical protein
MTRIVRRRNNMADLSLHDLSAARGMESNLAFADPDSLLLQGKYIHPAVQFLLRWCIHYPIAIFWSLFNPVVWILSLPLAGVAWMVYLALQD